MLLLLYRLGLQVVQGSLWGWRSLASQRHVPLGDLTHQSDTGFAGLSHWLEKLG